MDIGLLMGPLGLTPAAVEDQARAAQAAGYSALWTAETDSWDPLTLLGRIGETVPAVRLGTSVLRTYPRHPVALAAQALTLQALTGNRLVLGLGTGHRPIIEKQYGLSFEAPARNTREYLEILLPLLRGEQVSYQGRHWSANARLSLPQAAGPIEPPVVLVSALGPKMLRLTGELADGTITVWVSPRYLDRYIVPPLHAAAEAAGRGGRPKVLASLMVSVTADPQRVREWTNERYAAALTAPGYRVIFEREGHTGLGDSVLAGDEELVEKGLRAYVEAGVSEFIAIPIGPPEDQARTRELLPRLSPGT